MILHALTQGCRRFYLVLSPLGPADGGLGMLEALGMKFIFDDRGEIVQADDQELKKTLRGLTFIALCDPQDLYRNTVPASPLIRWLKQTSAAAERARPPVTDSAIRSRRCCRESARTASRR